MTKGLNKFFLNEKYSQKYCLQIRVNMLPC
nr:MAG TPA: hypothetical protein [Caudoviricetes sp.]